jgi:hypothetical protein
MKSKVAQKIMEETPEEVKSSARLYADKLVLENKIREALPRLKELTKGCLITVKEYPNEIIELSSNHYPAKVNALTLEGKHLVVDFDDAWGSYNTATYLETMGHPIRLNDVLEWLCKSKNYSCNMQDGNFYIFGHVWDLSSVFLADQSEELIKFLNEL